jgi:DNA-binding Lrp family transcriptional regulator
MDEIDRRILTELQLDARLKITTLAQRIHVGISVCHRRLRELEHSGAIVDYRTRVDPEAIGLGVQALLFVTMRHGEGRAYDEFETAIATVPEIVDVQRLFGEPDYVLRVITRDLASYQQLYDAHLLVLPGLSRLTSSIVMKRVISDRPLPID